MREARDTAAGSIWVSPAMSPAGPSVSEAPHDGHVAAAAGTSAEHHGHVVVAAVAGVAALGFEVRAFLGVGLIASPSSGPSLLPLDRRRRLGRDVVDHSVHPRDL